jgi:chromosome segregation ATPase
VSLFGNIAGGVANLAKSLNLMEERFRRHEDEVRQLRSEHNALSKEVAALTTRVAVLEAERKTIAAEVEAALTRTVSLLERRYIEAEAELRVKAALEQAKRPAEPPPTSLPSGGTPEG